MIETGVILAAGRGTRLGPLTAHEPKPMTRIGVTTVIDRILTALLDAGLQRLVVVTGHLGDELESYLRPIFGPNLDFVRQDERLGTGHALALCRDAVDRTRPVFVGWGDIVTAEEDYATVVASWRPGIDAIVGVNRLDDVSAGAAVVVDDQGDVTAIVEKPSREAALGPWNNAGLMVLGPDIWEQLDGLPPSVRGELELTDALAALIDAGRRVVAAEVLGPWFDVGTPDSLEAARNVYG